jgi:hypothetical protein
MATTAKATATRIADIACDGQSGDAAGARALARDPDHPKENTMNPRQYAPAALGVVNGDARVDPGLSARNALGLHPDLADPISILPQVRGGVPGGEAAIRTAAYYLAQARDFAPGHALDDWLAAEWAIGQAHVGG